MTELNLWQGGIKIISQEEIDEQSRSKDEKRGQEKFDTCRHRSPKPVERVKRSCCSSVSEKGYFCELRKIFKLTPDACSTCTLYEAKS